MISGHTDPRPDCSVAVMQAPPASSPASALLRRSRIRPRNESRSDHGDACVHVVGSSESTSDIPYPLGAAVPRVMSDTSGE